MQWFDRMKAAMTPTRTKGLPLDSARLLELIVGGGGSVTPATAVRFGAVYACVKVISESIAQLPVDVLRKDSSGDARSVAASVADVLAKSPNDFQTSFEFREMMQWHLLLRGNAYAQITRDSRGNVTELIPIHPDAVTVDQGSDYSLVYTVRPKSGQSIRVPAARILHLKGSTTDGFKGLSVIEEASNALSVATAAEDMARHMFRNRANPGGVLRHPGRLSAEAQARMIAQFEKASTGDNALRTVLLEEGMAYERVGMTAQDAQFLELRKFQNQQIYALFRVPPHKVGDLERATFSNIEHMAIEFVQDTLLPWVKRWEGRCDKQLMTGAANGAYTKFNVNGLLRGDAKSRADAYAIGRQWGWLSVNDVRGFEDMSRVEGGEVYLQPMNMEQLGAKPASDAPAPDSGAVAAAAKAIQAHNERLGAIERWQDDLMLSMKGILERVEAMGTESEHTRETLMKAVGLGQEASEKSINAVAEIMESRADELRADFKALYERSHDLLAKYEAIGPRFENMRDMIASKKKGGGLSIVDVKRDENGRIVGANIETKAS